MPRRVVFVIGSRQTGKTIFANQLAQELGGRVFDDYEFQRLETIKNLLNYDPSSNNQQSREYSEDGDQIIIFTGIGRDPFPEMREKEQPKFTRIFWIKRPNEENGAGRYCTDILRNHGSVDEWKEVATEIATKLKEFFPPAYGFGCLGIKNY